MLSFRHKRAQEAKEREAAALVVAALIPAENPSKKPRRTYRKKADGQNQRGS